MRGDRPPPVSKTGTDCVVMKAARFYEHSFSDAHIKREAANNRGVTHPGRLLSNESSSLSLAEKGETGERGCGLRVEKSKTHTSESIPSQERPKLMDHSLSVLHAYGQDIGVKDSIRETEQMEVQAYCGQSWPTGLPPVIAASKKEGRKDAAQAAVAILTDEGERVEALDTPALSSTHTPEIMEISEITVRELGQPKLMDYFHRHSLFVLHVYGQDIGVEDSIREMEQMEIHRPGLAGGRAVPEGVTPVIQRKVDCSKTFHRSSRSDEEESSQDFELDKWILRDEWPSASDGRGEKEVELTAMLQEMRQENADLRRQASQIPDIISTLQEMRHQNAIGEPRDPTNVPSDSSTTDKANNAVNSHERTARSYSG
ncbi:hypothetical protein QQF64_023392 [Cirrhinus molitorella]|uniref:Uncharacterized protein n=1 Tax=Cirrhinus molitorella TaxID=172907 RepID=A0ABR3L533_9TELE